MIEINFFNAWDVHRDFGINENYELKQNVLYINTLVVLISIRVETFSCPSLQEFANITPLIRHRIFLGEKIHDDDGEDYTNPCPLLAITFKRSTHILLYPPQDTNYSDKIHLTLLQRIIRSIHLDNLHLTPLQGIIRIIPHCSLIQ